ncbi:hypothetical protein DL93DRAFT_2099735 [Clavulina sp. PMI_390]|nr:hypothetical protein DL93DRAFT_2099735 [Clavulina sp. PMI_390]
MCWTSFYYVQYGAVLSVQARMTCFQANWTSSDCGHHYVQQGQDPAGTVTLYAALAGHIRELARGQVVWRWDMLSTVHRPKRFGSPAGRGNAHGLAQILITLGEAGIHLGNIRALEALLYYLRLYSIYVIATIVALSHFLTIISTFFTLFIRRLFTIYCLVMRCGAISPVES